MEAEFFVFLGFICFVVLLFYVGAHTNSSCKNFAKPKTLW